jgi:hypothetical protein
MPERPSTSLGWKVTACAFLLLGVAGLASAGYQLVLMVGGRGGAGPAGFVVLGTVLPLIAGAGLTLLGFLMLKPPRRP